MNRNSSPLRPALALALLCSVAAPTFAGPPGGSNTGGSAGVVLIDQAKAESGGVTPGDVAGFPVTISQPGNYRLAGPLTVSDANVSAIVIASDNVTLDLNGYTLQGPVSCTGLGAQKSCAPLGVGDGIQAVGRSGIALHGGRVRGFAFGVQIGARNAVEGVFVSHNSKHGISAAGDSRIHGNSVFNNGWSGIFAIGSLITNNTVTDNRVHGIATDDGGLVLDNKLTLNGGWGLTGSSGFARNSFIQNQAPYSNSALAIGPNWCGVIC
ncbi:MAG: right-handed parallel beta-helix repeat-containing protein [Pseudomonadota bacterium]